MIEIRTRIPIRAAEIIEQLIVRGYFSSMADFARQSILDKLLQDYEIGIEELEPEILKRGNQISPKKKS